MLPRLHTYFGLPSLSSLPLSLTHIYTHSGAHSQTPVAVAGSKGARINAQSGSSRAAEQYEPASGYWHRCKAGGGRVGRKYRYRSLLITCLSFSICIMLYFQLVIMAGTVMLAYYFEYTDTFTVHVQGFFCYDTTYTKPYLGPEDSSAVPPILLYAVVAGLPTLLVSAQLTRLNRSCLSLLCFI